jgi:hypothetical protein
MMRNSMIETASEDSANNNKTVNDTAAAAFPTTLLLLAPQQQLSDNDAAALHPSWWSRVDRGGDAVDRWRSDDDDPMDKTPGASFCGVMGR